MLSSAPELDELAATQRLLDQVQLSLDRARTAAAQSDPNNRRRYLFDYKKANEDLNTMRTGIDRYKQPSRAQPLDYGKVSGDYTRGRRYGDDCRAGQRV
ncbi:RAQPRD family integrative conjugative element protein [Pantoea sp. CTOTU49201]|uniref:integrative conjugative element protein, RAQPRD family n=1 Tax=Pantoea sp. CTOTU49201 TaxID=2953855 RepID=UPI00289A555D|nr:RAQPRD family integrative conjugative element protein [Pantoea sp. CTOTU49201]